MALPTPVLLRQADRLGLARNAPERRECRALSQWLAAQPRPAPVERSWSLDEIGEEIRRLEQAG